MAWFYRYDMSNDGHRRGKQTGTLGHVKLSLIKLGRGNVSWIGEQQLLEHVSNI